MGTAAGELALVMSGGGARAAYQVGFLRAVAERRPDLALPILTGVSAGAINAAWLASHQGDLRARVEGLAELWSELTISDVFHTDGPGLAWRVARWGARLVSGGLIRPRKLRGMVDTAPLDALLRRALESPDGRLDGIDANIASGNLRAFALTATAYATGQTVTFVQGRDIRDWERPNRIGRRTNIGVEHVMASAALPLFFPAARVGNAWFGDGGIRLTAPLAPAVHLGANRILAISTRYAANQGEASQPVVVDYPPPAQVAGVLLNAIFLDRLDADALTLGRINGLLREIPEERRGGLRPIAIQVFRPSRDLGKYANEFEARLPRALRFLTTGIGTKETRSNDLLSLILFQPDYLRGLLELGAADAERNMDSILRFLDCEEVAA